MDGQHDVTVVRHRPVRDLTAVTAGIVGLRERAPGVVERLQPAGTLLPLVISFGNGLEVTAVSEGVGAGRFGSFVAGFSSGYARTRFVDDQECVQVYLHPLGVGRVLGLPGKEIANNVIELTDVAAPGFGGLLGERLSAESSWEERFRIVELVIRAQLERHRPPPGWVSWMWGQIRARGGQVRIGDLVRECGWSHRHVNSVFSEHVGLSPKAAADVVRFERAAADMGSMPAADVAAKHGYADQSHMNRSFARHAAETPVMVGASRRPTPFTALGERP